MHNKRVSYLGFKETLPLFVFNYWLREFPLSAIANRFELQCQSKATHAMVLQTCPCQGRREPARVQEPFSLPENEGNAPFTIQKIVFMNQGHRFMLVMSCSHQFVAVAGGARGNERLKGRID